MKRKSNYGKWLLKNAVAGALALWLLSFAFSKPSPYLWVHNMLRNNVRTIKANPNLSFDDKMLLKLGETYNYLLYVKRRTPDNAVILFPSKQDFIKPGSPFKHEVYNKVFATRFLYPRRLVQEQDLADRRGLEKITHFAIVNGSGLDKLNFPVDSTVLHTVIPVILEKK